MDREKGSRADQAAAEAMSVGERAIEELLSRAHLASAHEVPEMVTEHAQMLGAVDAVIYLADLQQLVLVPFLPPGGPGMERALEPLGVDSTVAGRCFTHVSLLTQELSPDEGQVRLWLPLLDGTERLGVLSVDLPDRKTLERDELLLVRLTRLASLTAELVVSKSQYGDTPIRLRRTADMGLAAEIQWSVLPPLTFASPEVTIAAVLEPAYEVAGDSLDYAVDAGRARVALFDGMGHGLQSSQLAVVAISAFRNARRRGAPLLEVVRTVDAAVTAVFAGEAFTTALFGDLDTDAGVFTWVNAGHPPPLLLRDGRFVGQLESVPMLPLGLAEGLEPGTDIDVGRLQLEPGDQLLLYTDGVTEARSPSGELYGIERLTDLVRRALAGALPTPETMRRVVRDLLEYQQGQLSDDASLMMLEWRSDRQFRLVPDVGAPFRSVDRPTTAQGESS